MQNRICHTSVIRHRCVLQQKDPDRARRLGAAKLGDIGRGVRIDDPNPVKDILKINFGHPVEGTIDIEIMNIAGQLVFSQKMATDGFSQTAINVQQLKPGIYFLRVINDSFPFTGRKFVKAD